ncbi:MAG: hypothetical protein U0869_19410 [Chloroflexota bacterium]
MFRRLATLVVPVLTAILAANPGAAVTPAPSPGSDPTVTASPSTIPGVLPATELLPPPAWFDPRSVPILTDATGDPTGDLTDGLWLSALDGSDARLIAPSAASGAIVAGHQVLAVVPEGDRWLLRLFRPDGSHVDTVPDPFAGWSLDTDRDTAIVMSQDPDRLLLVDLRDGTTTPAPTGSHPIGGDAVLSPDERSFAWACCRQDLGDPILRYRAPSGETFTVGRGRLVGIDLRDRLWYQTRDQWGRLLRRFDPERGRSWFVRRLPETFPTTALTEDGRYLVIGLDPVGDREFVVIQDLADGDRWKVVIPPSWLLEAGSRYLLYGTTQDGAPGTVVIDLLERWAGFVPTHPPAPGS